jgi:hypothetical protein
LQIAQSSPFFLSLYDFKIDKRTVFSISDEQFFTSEQNIFRAAQKYFRAAQNIFRADQKYFIAGNILVSVDGKSINPEIFLRELTESNIYCYPSCHL